MIPTTETIFYHIGTWLATFAYVIVVIFLTCYVVYGFSHWKKGD